MQAFCPRRADAAASGIESIATTQGGTTVSAIAESGITNERQSAGRAVVAATVGNMLEWYDFTIYAAFAVPISKASPKLSPRQS